MPRGDAESNRGYMVLSVPSEKDAGNLKSPRKLDVLVQLYKNKLCLNKRECAAVVNSGSGKQYALAPLLL